MPPLFWLDVVALSVSLVISSSLTLMVLGAEPKRALNQTFALFTLVQAAWAVFSLLQRLGLWLGKGDPLLLIELIAAALGVVGPCLLIFTARYLERRTRWIDIAAVLGLVAIAVICIPLFDHRLVLNPRLHANGTTLADISPAGLLVMPLPLVYEAWSVILFWQDRRRIREPYLALSALILLAGYVVGGVLNVHVPVTSITHTLSVVILGYGVVRRQLFNPLRDRTLALQREIEERQQVEAELQFSNVILKTQQEASPDGILVVDERDEMISFNQRFVDMWGIPEDIIRSRSDELAQQSVLDKLVDPEAFLARVAYLYEHREEESWEEIDLVDGRAFERHSAPMFGADGQYYGRVWTFRDVTEARVAAQEAKSLNEELEQRIAERTAELEAANQELESFVYSASHDLRAPLRAMDGFSRIVLQDHAAELSPDVQRYLHIVRDNVRHMSTLLDGLLSLSRLGRLDLRKQMIAPGELVHQVLEELRTEHKDRQVEVTVGDLPACQADPVLLKQVYANLLSNAYKFTRKREAARIEVGCQQKDGERVYYVQDNGVGFDQRYADKLFGVFQRLHSTGEYEGTGVGLAIVQRIVRYHGGRVWAEAAVDKGATFYFTLG
jgi:signal transduction histidine kinase